MSDETKEAVQRTWTEAPASATVKARYAGREWMLTVRDDSVTGLIGKVEVFSNWLDKHTDAAINVEPPAPTVTTIPAPVTGAPAPAASGVQTIRAVKLQIEPRADGKVNLLFFEAGHQYADIRATKTPAEAVTMLQPIGAWTLAHMIASEYQINAVIDWANSTNTNKNGKPYKNIVTISAAK
jgi:hypothetical protein